jgi:EAL domain-containing protein (putative c-di-GMP-specific phosphodiesterase class I)
LETGYSSLSYLVRFPLDGLEIDRAFVQELGDKTEPSAIVAAIVGLARALEMSVAAELVESEAQLQEIRRLGCDRARGFHFAPCCRRRMSRAGLRSGPKPVPGT